MDEKSQASEGPIPRMLRAPEVQEITGLSAVTLWRLEREGGFPRRRRLMRNTIAWNEDEVRQWVWSREPVSIPDADGDPEDG